MIKNKKSIHINVDPEDHAAFKIQCVKRDLSMQQVFAAFARRVGLESSDMIRFLDQIANEKNVKVIKKKYKLFVTMIHLILIKVDLIIKKKELFFKEYQL